jgi:hypothetical protein
MKADHPLRVSVEKCRETQLVKREHCSDVEWEKLGEWGVGIL